MSCQGARPHCLQEITGHQNLLQSLGTTPKPPTAPAKAKEPPVPAPAPAPAPAPPPAPVPANRPRVLAAWGRCCFFAACWEADGTQKTTQKEENPQTKSSHLCITGEEERLGGGSCAGTRKAKASIKPPHPPGLSRSRPPRSAAGLFYFVLPAAPYGLEPSPATPPRRHQAGARLQILTVTIPRSPGARDAALGAVCGAGTAVGLPWLRGEREKSILKHRGKHPEIQLGGCERLTPAAERQQVNTKPTLAGSLSPSLSFILFKYRPSLLFFFFLPLFRSLEIEAVLILPSVYRALFMLWKPTCASRRLPACPRWQLCLPPPWDVAGGPEPPTPNPAPR